MVTLPRALRIFLLMFLPLSAYADYSPGQLILRLNAPPQRTMDGVIQATGVTGIDAMVSAGQAQVTPTLAEFADRFREVESIVSLSFSLERNLDSLENVLAADPNVEWVTRNYIYDTNSLDDGFIPNDSLFSEEWWLDRISAPLAWEISQGDTTIVIGIIDTGVDYLHPDIAPNLWHNWADADSDGVDDDNNGFIDDVIGWDFVDAPTLPAYGDHLVRDNDPMDEPGGIASGHGTYVTGIASAATDNELCVASIGFHCRIMCLRAGNTDGNLEEDDIAAALLYGAVNGASVINMSFGDVVASPLLREAVMLANEAGVVLAASAGNQGSFPQRIHYPSGYAEVISVGATDRYDRRADFSNYGPMVDVMAPGDQILSTILGGNCGEWTYSSGTSYASPMVCGVAGLIRSVNPQLSPADVAQVITSTADDIGSEGWDPPTVHGRVNARRAVEQAQYGSDVVARIRSPRIDQGMSADFTVSGEAWGAVFDHYELSHGIGENPDEWISDVISSDRHYGDVLGTVTLPAVDTVLIVRLEAVGTNGFYSVDNVHVFVQRAAPRIDTMWTLRMLDYDTYGDLVQVRSNQVTTASFILTNAAGDSLREDFGYVSDTHAGTLSLRNHPGAWTAWVRLENRAGLVTVSDSFAFEISEPPFTTNLWERTTTNLPNGFIGPFTTDYDCDHLPEVWVQPTSGEFTSDYLQPFKWDGSQFVPAYVNYPVNIPQATGDADGDSLIEIMARFGQSTIIWEQMAACGVPNNVVLLDSASFIGAGFVTVDSASGRQEILARVEITVNNLTRQRFVLFDVQDDYALVPTDTLPNTTSGSNDLGPPVVLSGDLDQDGLLDFVFGDYDGDVIFCERSNGHTEQRWTTRLPINDATSWLGQGDLNGDGTLELIAGCRSNAGGGSESQRRAQHWEYFIFSRAGDNNFIATDSIFILGNENVSSHHASVTVADVDADGRGDILISAYPDYYIITYDQSSGRYLPRWYYTPSESNTSLVVDLDGDGVNDILVADGESVLRIEAASASGQRPAPPLHLSGEPLNATTVFLQWYSVPAADSYFVYRAVAIPDFQRIAVATDTFAVIGLLPQDSAFVYTVTTVDRAYPIPESVQSNFVTLAANSPPTLDDTAQFVEPHHVRLRFSEPMGESALAQWNYRLDGSVIPDVILGDEGNRAIVLAFTHGLTDGWHTLTVRDLRDAQNSLLPAEEDTVVFNVVRVQTEGPHVLSHRIIGGPSASQVEISFSEPMSVTVLDAANYQMDAPHHVTDVHDLATDHSRVQVMLDPRYPVGALDLPARLRLRNLTNASGAPMDTSAGRADLVLGGAAESIADIFVYPNPYRGAGPNGEQVVVFAGLPEQATIRIFTIQGTLVRRLDHQNSTGAARWDLTNDQGEAVASGVYLYSAVSSGETVRGKFAIMR